MSSSASDVRAGGAFYELYARDELSAALARVQARVRAVGRFLSAFDPGAGGAAGGTAGAFNRLVFGDVDIDAKSGEYLGRVGGLVGPLRALLGAGGAAAGLVNDLLFGAKRTDAAGAYLGRVGGLIGPVRDALSPGASGQGLVNDLLFGAKRTDAAGAYLGRAGGLVAPLRTLFRAGATGTGLVGQLLFGSKGAGAGAEAERRYGGLAGAIARTLNPGAGGSGIVNRLLFGDKKEDAAGAYAGRIGGLFGAVRAGAGVAAGAFAAVNREVSRFVAGLSAAGTKLALVGGATAAPLLAAFKAATDRGADLVRRSRELGVPIELLNKFQYAAERAGVSLDEVMQDRQGRYTDLIAAAPSIDVTAAVRAEQAQRDLADATRALQDALAPFVAVVGRVAAWFGEWAKENGELVATVFVVTTGVLGLGLALAAVGTAVTAFASLASGAFAAVGAVIGAVLSPVGLVVAAVGGLVYLLGNLSGLNQRVAGDFKKVFSPEWAAFADRAKQSWATLVNFVKKGDLESAFATITTSLELLWNGACRKLTESWIGFEEPFIEGWQDTVVEFALAFIRAGARLEKAWITIGGNLENAFKAVARTVSDAAIGAAEVAARLDPTDALDKKIAAAKALNDRVIGKSRDLPAERQKVEDDKDRAVNDVIADARRDKDRGRVERRAGLEELNREKAQLEAELDRLKKLSEEPDAALRPGVTPLKPGLLQADKVAGGFSGAALDQQFGYGSEVQKQTELLKALVTATQATPGAIVTGLKPLVAPAAVR